MSERYCACGRVEVECDGSRVLCWRGGGARRRCAVAELTWRADRVDRQVLWWETSCGQYRLRRHGRLWEPMQRIGWRWEPIGPAARRSEAMRACADYEADRG